jgi:hypothetical protein
MIKNKNVLQQNLYAMPFGSLRIAKTLGTLNKTNEKSNYPNSNRTYILALSVFASAQFQH